MSYTHIQEHAVSGRRLGRHINRDPRSLAYRFTAPVVPVVSKAWKRNIPWLDQGSVGSCVGNAMDGAVGTTPIFEALPITHPVLDESLALRLYHEATVLDPYPGTYPPDDTGSDGTSVAQAAKNDGFISAYLHCLTLDEVLQALMYGPGITGINWYSSFDYPDSTGLVTISPNAYVRGGHEVLMREVRVENSMLYLDNSWGPDWGLNGSFHFSFDTFARLISASEGGDFIAPLPLTDTPTPPPPPPPTPTDPVLYTTDGTRSLHYISNHNALTPVAAIIQNTLLQYTQYEPALVAYFQVGDLTRRMPAGIKLCFANPVHTIV
jgi:hypothetical protein